MIDTRRSFVRHQLASAISRGELVELILAGSTLDGTAFIGTRQVTRTAGQIVGLGNLEAEFAEHRDASCETLRVNGTGGRGDSDRRALPQRARFA